MFELLPEPKHPRYLARYITLIENMSTRKFEGYTEKHHILPRSMFPNLIKDDRNIIIVPARVHFILHYLLWKAYRDRKTWNAFKFMISKNSVQERYFNSRLYASLKEANIKMPEDHKKKISNSLKGIKRSDETRTKMKISNKQNCKNRWQNFSGHSLETKIKMSQWQKGKAKPQVSGLNNGKSKQIIFRDKQYHSIRQCSSETKISPHLIRKEMIVI